MNFPSWVRSICIPWTWLGRENGTRALVRSAAPQAQSSIAPLLVVEIGDFAPPRIGSYAVIV